MLKIIHGSVKTILKENQSRVIKESVTRALEKKTLPESAEKIQESTEVQTLLKRRNTVR